MKLFLCLLLHFQFLSQGTSNRVRDLHREVSVGREDFFNFSHTRQLLLSLSQEELNVPLFAEDGRGGRPLLHHFMNLYFIRQSAEERKELVEMMLIMIQKKIDINSPYLNDPDVLFKSIVIRELALSRALVRGGGMTNNSLSLTQLYSVPCDPIPLSKLLLHAHSIVKTKKKEAEDAGASFGLNDVKELLASASLGAGAKPAAKTKDLDMFSKTFEKVLENMLGDSEELKLMDVMNSLGELGSAVHASWLESYLLLSSDTVTGLGHLANLLATFDKKGRNPLHTLALSGSASLTNDLVDVFSLLDTEGDLEAVRRVRGKLDVALAAVDIRGHTPISYAALRYGADGSVYFAFKKLASLSGTVLDTVLEEFLLGSYKNHSQTEKNQVEGHHQPVGIGGGWSSAMLPDELRGDSTRCDILEVWSAQPTPVDFFVHYIALGKPVIFRRALQTEDQNEMSIRRHFQKDTFLKKYGNEIIPVSAIPYASSFGVKSNVMMLADVANRNDLLTGDDANPPLYAFNTAMPKWRQRLEEDVGLPSLLEGGGLVNDVEMQFYLGQAGTGAPMHFHGHAVNSLAYGEKKWFLQPPSSASYSKTPSLEFAKYLQSHPHKASSLMQCTQKAGDVIYVPTLWGHATLNTMQSIGVAHEFSVDDICME